MKINNENFISELKKQNKEALEYFVKNYGGLIKAVVYRILYSYPEDAEECFYDIIVKIWNNINSFDENKSSFSNWIAAVSKYRALDKLRKLSRYDPLSDIDNIQISDKTHFTDNEIFNEFFSDLISCLNDEDKKLFVSLFWYGKTYDELSVELKKDKKNLFNRISRGKKKIIAAHPNLFKKEKI